MDTSDTVRKQWCTGHGCSQTHDRKHLYGSASVSGPNAEYRSTLNSYATPVHTQQQWCDLCPPPVSPVLLCCDDELSLRVWGCQASFRIVQHRDGQPDCGLLLQAEGGGRGRDGEDTAGPQQHTADTPVAGPVLLTADGNGLQWVDTGNQQKMRHSLSKFRVKCPHFIWGQRVEAVSWVSELG